MTPEEPSTSPPMADGDTPVTQAVQTLKPRFTGSNLIETGAPIVQYTVRIYATLAVAERAHAIAVDMELAADLEIATRRHLTPHLPIASYTVDVEIGDVKARTP